MKKFLLLLLLALPARAEPQIKIFELANRPALATVEIVRALLQPGEMVWPEERLQRLIVKAAPERLEEVRKLLEQIDVAAPQVWLTVTQNANRPYSASAAGVGLNRRGRIVGQAQQVQVGQQVQETQKLLVMSGEKGEIWVGQDIPTVQPFWNFANGLGALPGAVVFQRVSTGFSVEPVVVGERIRLRVVPWMGYASPQGDGRIELTQAASTFNLANGETITLSSSSGSNQVQTSAFGLILGGGNLQQSSSNSIQVSAEIQMQ